MPAAVTTVTVTLPNPGGEKATKRRDDKDKNLAERSPKYTYSTRRKFSPTISTGVPPRDGPTAGSRRKITGTRPAGIVVLLVVVAGGRVVLVVVVGTVVEVVVVELVVVVGIVVLVVLVVVLPTVNDVVPWEGAKWLSPE